MHWPATYTKVQHLYTLSSHTIQAWRRKKGSRQYGSFLTSISLCMEKVMMQVMSSGYIYKSMYTWEKCKSLGFFSFWGKQRWMDLLISCETHGIVAVAVFLFLYFFLGGAEERIFPEKHGVVIVFIMIWVQNISLFTIVYFCPKIAKSYFLVEVINIWYLYFTLLYRSVVVTFLVIFLKVR